MPEVRKNARCSHDKVRSQCKACEGKSICEHGKRRSNCRRCGHSRICEHNNWIGELVYVKRECNPFYYEYELVGETSRSWLILAVGADAWMKCDLKRYAQKLPKNGKGYEFGTKRSMEMAEWAGKYRYNIGQLVGCLSDPHMLATIARMIGFKNLLEDNHEGSEGSSQGN